MSKRFVPTGRFIALVFALTALFLLSSQPLHAANSVVRIDKLKDATQGTNVWIGISLENQANPRTFGGFDFLIAYDAIPLSLQQVLPGAMLDSCGWEYFTYRTGPFSNCAGTCPSGMLRLVAIAETNNGNVHPWCFWGGESGYLAWMEFRVTDDRKYECTNNPISFYWSDCGDNVMSSFSGDSLFLSHRVYEFSGAFDITGQPGYGGWQGIAGNPDCLISPTSVDTVLDFYDGEVEILCADSIDTRGDINLNGIANEIADLVMFCNYFLYGLDAFSQVNVEGSIAASDVNADGIVLSFRDAVYLLRIVYGDALPFPKRLPTDNLEAVFHQDTTAHQVSVNFSGELAGAYLAMSDSIVPTFLIPHGFWQWYQFDGVKTHILILGDLDHRYSSGIWFMYEGTGVLQHVETADWFNNNVEARIAGAGSDCGDANASGNYDIADIVYLIRYIFSGGPAPLDSHGGDVNCDHLCDISDVVYMLQFIFAYGPAPCSGCR